MIRSLQTSASALVAQRVRMDVIAGNIANAFTTSTADGDGSPYRRRVVSFSETNGQGGPGVHVNEVIEDDAPFRLVFNPGHKDAIQEGPQAGYVQMPNVNLTVEYVDALEASRAYEANVSVMNVSRTMLNQAIELFA